jgi:sulfide dehydrogenase cytochrome subunit
MHNLIKALTISFLTTALGISGAAFAGEIAELAAQCDSCHGPGGASTQPDMPIIGGQSEAYILDSLKSFQDWGRPCIKSKYRFGDTSRPRTDMCKITAGLSNEDFAGLSVYYSGLPFVPAKQAFDASQVEAGAAAQAEHCESCHEQGGKGVGGRGPRLAGQWTPYLKATLKFVPTGEHLVPHVMEKTITDFTDDTLNQILNFYASQQD